jgi:pimeloyl-ACP methyl ester carboxylesterase
MAGIATDSAKVKPTVVLVHGDWADGSSWSGVINGLQERGFKVVAPPNPLRGPTADAAYIASFLKTVPGPIVLVGHSYGGFVITNAAKGNPNVKALVYIDAFIPDSGQRLLDLVDGSCTAGDPSKVFNAVPFAGGVDLYLQGPPNPPYTGFAECFANGVSPDRIPILFATQRPAALNQLFEPSGPPAWKDIPSWALIGTADHAIPEAQQELMAANAHAHVSEVDAGHLGLISKPQAVVNIILKAVSATS